MAPTKRGHTKVRLENELCGLLGLGRAAAAFPAFLPSFPIAARCFIVLVASTLAAGRSRLVVPRAAVGVLAVAARSAFSRAAGSCAFGICLLVAHTCGAF